MFFFDCKGKVVKVQYCRWSERICKSVKDFFITDVPFITPTLSILFGVAHWFHDWKSG